MAITTVKSGVSNGNATFYNSGRKLARTSNGDLHCVWADSRNTNQIYYAKSTDGGENWVETAITTDTSYSQSSVSIAVDSNDNIHLVWCGTHSSSSGYIQIRYRKYTDSWQTIYNVTAESYDQHAASIAIDSNDYIHIAWSGKYSGSTTQFQVRYTKFTTSWQAIEVLTSGNTYYQYLPSVAIDSNNNVHIVWFGKYSGSASHSQIRYIKYTTSWGSIENLTTNSWVSQSYPSLAFDSNDYLHVAWYGNHSTSGGKYQLRYRKYTTSWGSIENLTSENNNQQMPSIAVDGDDYIHIAWHGSLEGSTIYNIRYIKYTTSWGPIEEVTSSTTDNKRCPGCINALYPDTGSNIPETGCAFIWADSASPVSIKLYRSSDLTWGTSEPTYSCKVKGKWINKDSDNLTYIDDDLAIQFSDSSAADSNKVWSSEKINTISGTLQTTISGKSDSAHTHDDRYYTESEVDALTWLEVDITDLDKYTQAEVDTISGSINTDLTAHTSDVSIHREHNDAGTSNTELWSAAKIAEEITTATGTLVIDHGSTVGLSDDDHPQYMFVDGSRAFSATVGGQIPTAGTHLTTKSYVDGLVQGLDWQESVIDIAVYGAAVASGTNRYIASTTSGTWTEDYIYEWNGSSWDETIPTEGCITWVEDVDALYAYNNSAWAELTSTVTHNTLFGLNAGDFKHLTNDQYLDLTDSGDCSIHKHDDLYYLETEIDLWRSNVTQEEMGHLNGVTSDVQTQIDNIYMKSEVNTISGSIQTDIDAIVTHTEEIEYFTTTSGDITNKYVTLGHTPVASTEVALNIIDGGSQDYGIDYTVNGTQVGWNGLGLETDLVVGDKLRVIYSY